MTTISERYDRAAERYLRWWAPVLEPTAVRVLDLVEPWIRPGTRMVDIGTGTGVLAIRAVQRWPAVEATGIDGSTGMLAVAEDEARRRLGPAADRLRLLSGLADRIPAADGAFDLAISSFVLQLVPHRPRALREAHRVVRPRGHLAFVTWLVEDSPFAPDEAFYDALDDLGIDDPTDTEEDRSGDFSSPSAAAAQVRRAGFRDVVAWEEGLEYRYDAATYIEFLEQYAERATFDALDPEMADRLRAETVRRFATLAPDEFVWRMPVVFVQATRP
ncbi:MAG TPA: methyltransferase domain-containing protein [Candidatus Limnocylindrales bacterium]